MTVRVSKPEFDLRGKILDLDYSQVPYHKMPPGSIITSTVWKVPALAVSTSGSWAYGTVPNSCLLYTSPSPRDRQKSRMPSSA